MKICYFDAFSGISGDMTVGALVDAGADWAALEQALASLGLEADYRLEKTKRKGIAASKFSVRFSDGKKHRHLPHIESILNGGSLTPRARENALRVFRKLAEAEAKAHDVPLEKVHFHEVGAVDSISDIAGACVALDLLGVDEIRSSAVNVGGGTIKTEHGVLPVPTPATAELLKTAPVYSSGPQTELTTPTGAALLAALVSDFGALPPVRVLAQGFGAGDKEFSEQANVLRVLIGESTTPAEEATTVMMIEANIDDAPGQVLGYAVERLLGEGALDVTLMPVVMKKGRPGTIVSVMATPESAERLASILFAETTTLGVRTYRAERRVLTRHFASVETPYGPVRIKYTENGSFAPEFEDCRTAALQHHVPLRKVMAEASDAFRQQRTQIS